MLELSPQLPLASPLLEIAVAIGLVVPLLLLGMLYRYECRLVHPWVAAILLLTRASVVGVIGLVVAFRPVIAWTEEESLPTRLVVLADNSASVDVADPQRPLEERLRLASQLGLLPESGQVTVSQVQAWLDSAANIGEAELVAQQPRLKSLTAWYDQLPRRRIMSAVLQNGVWEHLARRHDLVAFRFGDRIEPLPGTESLAELATGGPTSVTDLLAPLEHTLRISGRRRGRIVGVILLTDGRDNAVGQQSRESANTPLLTEAGKQRGAAFAQLAAAFKGREIPVFPIALGPRIPPPDVRVVHVKAPANILKGGDASVNAEIRVTGLPPQALFADLLLDGKALGDRYRRIIRHSGKDRTYRVAFSLPLEEPGTHRIEVAVKAETAGVKEISTDNNRRGTLTRVAKDPARVLVIDGEARWEHHYLMMALRRDPMIKPQAVIFNQPRLGILNAAQRKDAGHPEEKLPKWNRDSSNADPLSRYACIVLGDVDPADLPFEDCERLAKYVGDAGGTLVLVAGRRAMPLRYLATTGGEINPIAKLLPLVAVRELRLRNGFHVSLTFDGRQRPFLQLEASPEQSLAVWARLPVHYWAAVGKPRPSAEPLAVAAAVNADQSRPDDEQALLAVHNYGFGKVVYVGLDSTWRWRYRKGDLYHHRFWGQLLRWAASDRLLPAGNEIVRYGTDKPAYRRGETVRVHVRMEKLDRDLSEIAKTAKVRIVRQEDGRTERTIPLRPVASREGLLRADVTGLPAGAYRLAVDLGKVGSFEEKPGESSERRRDAFQVLPSPTEELEDLSVNWPLLESLANRTGGRVLAPWQVGELESLAAAKGDTLTRHREIRLWHDVPFAWYLLAAVVGLLAVEWTARKLAGLA